MNISIPTVKLTPTLVNISIPRWKLMSRAGKILFSRQFGASFALYEHQYSHGKTDIYACGHPYSVVETDAKGGEDFVPRQFGASFALL